MKYDIVVRPLPEDMGGGYVGIVPDLRGCMSDGDTPEEAIANTVDAAREWLELHERTNRPIPQPGWALEKALEEKEALRRAINILSGDLTNRIDDIESRMVELQAVLKKLEDLTNPSVNYLADLMAGSKKEPAHCH